MQALSPIGYSETWQIYTIAEPFWSLLFTALQAISLGKY